MERLEPRLALAIDFAGGLPTNSNGDRPADMTASAYLFIGDHSASNSEIWRMNVASVPLPEPKPGEVLWFQRTFARGASYPITVDWVDTNRSAGPDYDYRAWIDRSAIPTWTSGAPIPSSQDFFVTDPGQLLQRRWFGSDVNATLNKTAEVHFPAVDLDVDSDNSGYVEGSLAEDALELVSTTGVNVPVSTSSMAGLTPLILGLSDNLRYAATAAQVSLTFSTTASTRFRLWRDAGRTQALSWGNGITAANLGLALGGRVTLYLEALTSASSFSGITTTATVSGSVWQGTLRDTVHARGVPGVDLDVDSDNSGTLDRSAYEDGIEESTSMPGVIVPVGGARAKMVVEVPAGRTASLAFDAAAAGRVRVFSPSGALVLDSAQLSTTVVGGSPQTFWIEAFAPSVSLADIAFTLTLDVSPGSGSAGTGSTGSAPSDTVRATAVELDLDVDSNNDDRLDTPKRDPDEETKEATTPKKIVVNNNDTDGDHVPDYADWSIAGKRFTPLVVQIPASLPLASMQFAVSYTASDPALVGADHRLPSDSGTRPLRIWTKNASQQRNPASITAGGNFVPAGRIADLGTLGFTDSSRTVELYVEGIQTTAGISLPISIELIVGDRVTATDLVTVIVVSNTLVIGIDGTDQMTWLAGKNAKRPNGLWNSHVRNLIDDVWAFTMIDYHLGPTGVSGQDSTVVKDHMTDRAEDIIADAGGGTTVAIVGWSRGAMIGVGAANALSTSDKADKTPRTVAFVGMYDPVDESAWIPAAWHVVDKGVEAVTIVGPFDPRREAAADVVNVDYAVTYDNGAWLNVEFTREAYFDKDKDDNWTIPRLSHAGGEGRITREEYNASHGSIGGTPGYSPQHKEPPNGKYNYDLDKDNSFEADKDIRDGLRAAGLEFVPNRPPAWYGFFDKRPKTL